MAFYCLTMLSMALELAQIRTAYLDMASKFFEHFVAICESTNTLGGTGLWDEEDGFYYDPHWKELVLFYEYFHGETGRGCGANHQTGWTGIVTQLMRIRAKRNQTRVD
jgi:hypothetical protein